MKTDSHQQMSVETQADMNLLWGLDEPLRLPAGLEGWDKFHPIQIFEEPELFQSGHGYADIIGLRSRHETIMNGFQLTKTFPDDFAAAAQSIRPEAWRWLYYSGMYLLENLTSFRFHPDQELRRICDSIPLIDDVPLEWIQSTSSARDIAEDTSMTLRYLGSSPARAVWCILAVAQRLPLTKSEVLHCRWWDPKWIQALAIRFNTEI